jgi:hypothetical protein
MYQNRNILFLTLILLIFNSISQGSQLIQPVESEVYLESIPPVLPPEISENRVTYTVFFVFDRCPEEQWAYFNNDSSRLVIDFYSVYISKSPGVVIKGAPIIHSIEVKNTTTDLAMSGRRSQIILNMDSLWHYQTTIISEKVLRLEIWKELNPVVEIKKAERSWKFPLLTTLLSVLGAGLTVGLLTLFGKPD